VASTRSRPRGREQARPISGGPTAEHATKIYGIAIASVVVIVAFLALTGTGHVIDAATQHFMLFYAGVFALIALCASVALGLIATDRMILHPGHRIFVQSAHRAASFGAVAFLIIHIVTEILAQRVHVLDAFVPFLSPFRTFYIGLGTIASDLVLLLVITGILRKRFTAHGKAWRWRAIHYTSYVAFVFGVWHGLLGGRAGKPYVDWSYGFVVALVALGLAVRILANSLRPKESLSAPPVPESASSGSAPMRAASMFAQLGLMRAATSATVLEPSAPHALLAAPADGWTASPMAAPAPAYAALPPPPPGPYDVADSRQVFYEPGYEGPPRYLGAPREESTGPLPRANGGALPRANSGPLPRASTGPLPRANSGPLPRADTGPLPRADGRQLPRARTGPLPRVPGGPGRGALARPGAASGPMPQVPGNPAIGRGTGPMPRANGGPLPQANSGPMPRLNTGPMRRANSSPLPRANTGSMPRLNTGPMPRSNSGPLPRADTGSMPRAATGPMPSAQSGPMPRAASGPMPSAESGPMPRAASGPMPSAGGQRSRRGSPTPPGVRAGQPRAGQSRNGQPRAGRSRDGQPRNSQPRNSQQGTRRGDGRSAGRNAGGQGRPAAPGWAQTPGSEGSSGWTDAPSWANTTGWDGGVGWDGAARVGGPDYGQPEYGQPEYGQMDYSPTEYGQMDYGQPEYGSTEYGQPPWEGGGAGPDPGFRYREPGPGMPGYRGPSGRFRSGEDLR
jgi:DMSO/TMAO reductase YedYZ heme-binding membrane subunit